MKWDLFDSANWQCLLDSKIMEEWLKQTNTKQTMTDAGVIHSGTQLDMPNSWCERLFLGNIGEHMLFIFACTNEIQWIFSQFRIR